MCECKIDSSKDQIKPAGGVVGGAAHAPAQPRRRLAAPPNYMGFWWTSCLTVLGTSIIVAWIPNLLSPEPPKGNVDGFISPKLKKVEEVFRLHLLSSEEKGAAFAVFQNGRPVVDLWGGYADIHAWQPWKKSTVANTFSLHTVAISLCLGLLYERGLIDYDDPVSKYWPEFSQCGKDKITVRQLLSEQAGLGKLNQSISISKFSDTKYIHDVLVKQETQLPGLIWRHYDPAVLELYADQLVRKVDKQARSLKRFFEEEFISSSGIDYHIGLPLSEQHRSARVRGHDFSIIFEVLIAPIELTCTLLSYIRSPTFTEINSVSRHNDPEIRLSPIGSVSAFSSARALAELYRNAILSDSASSTPLISAETWQKMSKSVYIEDITTLSQLFGQVYNYSVSAAGQIRQSPKGSLMIGHSAFGGQYAFVDHEKNISLAYLTNYNSVYNIELDPRFKSLLRAVYDNI